MQVDARQVAVMVDRVETLVNGYGEMRLQLENIRVSLAKIESVPQEMAVLRSQLDAHGKAIDRHNFIFKLFGTALALCISVVGWGWHEGKSFYQTDQAIDRRLLQIEFKLGILPTVPEG